ncbi:hypothetical protein ABZW11_08720 [Nonomuraea sp. NPDC004580]
MVPTVDGAAGPASAQLMTGHEIGEPTPAGDARKASAGVREGRW